MAETLENFIERIKTGKFSDKPELQAAYEQGRLDERCQNILNNSLVWSDGKERTKEQIDKAFPHLVNAINNGNEHEADLFIKIMEG